MFSFSKRVKAFIEARRRQCVNPSKGMFLNKFNKIMEGNEDQEITYLDDMVQHLVECRSCRQQLTKPGKYLFAAELFWLGYFLHGDEKVERRQLKEKLKEPGDYQEKVRLMKEISKNSRLERWKEERKKIDKFIEE